MTAVGIFAIIASDLMEGIKSDAQIDTLSGLFNRRGFEPRALNVLAERASGSAAMILSDLDLFKSINDRFGHNGGDRVIQKFSEVIRDRAPEDAVLARLGGEEFVIMVPSATAEAAQRLAEDVRSSFKHIASDIVLGASPTASFGIAIARENENLGALMERADRALYEAKNEGRDCVRLAG